LFSNLSVSAVVALLVAMFVAAPSSVIACDVPVFRYALERWPASFYNVIVFHRGELPAEARAAADWLGSLADEDANRPCNVAVRTFDVSAPKSADPNAAMPPAVEKIWNTRKDKPLPWMVACFPSIPGSLEPAWEGSATVAAARRLVDSPARRKIVEAICGGDSAVWILLECGNREKDTAAAAELNKQINLLTKSMGLVNADAPDADLAGIDYEEGPKLRIGFSMIRLRRDDPAESAFVKMLLATESDLAEVTADEPAVFTVYGQGRAMLALVGKGIGADNVGTYAGFVCGPCSCQVKTQNPGVDLLIAADWLAPFRDAPAVTVPLPDVIGAPVKPVAAAATQPVAPTSAELAGTISHFVIGPVLRAVLLTLGGLVVAGVVLVLWVARRGSGIGA